jgi:hypothetical protein
MIVCGDYVAGDEATGHRVPIFLFGSLVLESLTVFNFPPRNCQSV